MFRVLKNQNGFSLIQAMVLAGTIGVMAVLNMTIMNNQQRANKKNSDIVRSQSVVKAIKELLKDPNRCQHFMGSFAPSSFGGNPGHLIDPNGDGNIDADEAAVLNNQRTITLESPIAQKDYDTSQIVYKAVNTYPGLGEDVHSKLKIINFQTNQSANPANGRAAFSVHFFPEGDDDYYYTPESNVSGEFDIVFTLETGTGFIDTCVAVDN